MTCLRTLLMACLLFLAASPVPAAVIPFSASLSGSQEVPPRTTPATGDITVVANDVTEVFAISLEFSGLLGPTVAAHLHNALLGANGPIVLPLAIPVGVTAGSFTGVFTAAQFSGPFLGFSFAQILSAMEAGAVYVNVHTTEFPGGEIRGQLAVPEPSSAALVVTAALGLLVLRRRRAQEPG